MRGLRIAVVGSVNLDLVAVAARLPAPGETVTGAVLARHPGGKGANQALAARLLGAQTQLFARIGADAAAEEALALLRARGVDLSGCSVDPHAPTGTALIAVDAAGENQIVVAPGANAVFTPDALPGRIEAEALVCQMEIPVETVAKAASAATGWVCLNLAPARPIPAALIARADVIIVNEHEYRAYGEALGAARGWLAVTHGAGDAVLYAAGREQARFKPPKIAAIDTTGAGDAFCAALVVALREGAGAERALAFACAAGAFAASRQGAQPSFGDRAEIERFAAVAGAAG